MRASVGYKCFVALLAVVAEPVAAAPLQPTSKWHVDFADSQCVASRDYGPEGNPLFLMFKKPPIGDVLQIAVVRNGALELQDQTAGEIQFDERSPIKTSLLEYGVKNLGQRILTLNLKIVDPALRHASKIRIRTRPEILKYGETLPKAQSDFTFKSTDVPQS